MIGIIIGYMLGMLALGLYANRKQKNMDDYYVAGRRLGAFSIMCLWLASWVGGASVVGSANTAYEMGITAIWYVGTVAFGCILFALLFSHLIKKIGDKSKHITYPDLIEERYDSRCRIIVTVTTILAYIAYTAGQLAAAGSILHALLGWDLQIAFFVAAFVVIVYTATGGFLAVTYTDWVQFILLLVGVVLTQTLKESKIAGAALDVVLPEPLPTDHEIFKLDNAIFTPHAAFLSTVALCEVRRKCVEEVMRALKGKAPNSVVNITVLDQPNCRINASV